MRIQPKLPLVLGKVNDREVYGISVSEPGDVNKWSVACHCAIVFWDSSESRPNRTFEPDFRFWIQRGARTFCFGGELGRYFEDQSDEILHQIEKLEGFRDFVSTSNDESTVEAIWESFYLGWADDDGTRHPHVYVVSYHGTGLLKQAREWIDKMKEGWIPD